MNTTPKSNWESLAGTPVRAARLWQRAHFAGKECGKPTTSAKEFTKASSLSNPPESIRRSRGKMQQVTIDHQIYMAALAPHLTSFAFEQCS